MAAMPRLSDMLANSAGTLTYIVSGSKENDQHMLRVKLEGLCHLRCQRCLGEFAYPIEVDSHLQLLSSDKLDEIEADEVADGIEATPHLDLLELIEDEVLLSLPFAPKHPDGTCSTAVEGIKQSDNPFAVLAGLKKKQ